MSLPLIALAQPVFDGNERKYVADVLDTTRLSMGPYVARLEAQFAAHTGRAHAIACNSGTAALHLALLALGLEPGALVLMPALSYVATANAAVYCGARPVFCDVDPDTWQLHVASAREAVRTYGHSIKAIVAVDLYGGMGDVAGYESLATEFGVPLLFDAAESIGATFEMIKVGNPVEDSQVVKRPAGVFGLSAIFSLFGNKTITCGEGGVVVTDEDALAARMRLYRGQGQTPGRRYFHEVVGYNYRLTDLQAAVAVAQMEALGWHVERRRQVAEMYATLLPAEVGRQRHLMGTQSAHWMQAITVPAAHDRDVVALDLAAQGIETRPTFVPLHRLPMFRADARVDCAVSERIGRTGLCLPTHARLNIVDVARVTSALGRAIRRS